MEIKHNQYVLEVDIWLVSPFQELGNVKITPRLKVLAKAVRDIASNEADYYFSKHVFLPFFTFFAIILVNF